MTMRNFLGEGGAAHFGAKSAKNVDVGSLDLMPLNIFVLFGKVATINI